MTLLIGQKEGHPA